MSTAEDVLIGESEAPLPAVARKRPRRKRGFFFPLPASSLINFGALILLFIAITLLQQFSGRFSAPQAPAQNTTEPAAAVEGVTEAAVEPTAASEVTTEVTPPPPAPRGTPPGPAAKIASVPIALAIPEQPAADSPPAADVAPMPKQPVIDLTRETAEPAPPVRPVPKKHLTARETSFARSALEREIPVEELDDESARQAYLAANRTIQAVPTPPPAEPDDFIPYERR